MKRIDQIFIKQLLKGSSVLAGGGGLAYQDQILIAAKSNWQGLKLVAPENLVEKGTYVTVAELGPSNAPPIDKTVLPKLLKTWETHIGQTVDGIVPGEIGQEVITLEAAWRCGLPVVDTDLAGGRAVPKLSDLALVRQGVGFTMSPLVFLTAAGQMGFLAKQKSLNDDEKQLRRLVSRDKKQVVLFLGGRIKGKTIKEKLAYHSYSLAANLGGNLTSMSKLIKALPNKVIIRPEKVVVEKIEEVNIKGFFGSQVQLKGQKQNFQLKVENEFIELTTQTKKIMFPDLICLLDPDKLFGLSSDSLVVGKEVILIVFEKHEWW